VIDYSLVAAQRTGEDGMYIKDLTRTVDRRNQSAPVMLAVGWLDREHPFPTGETTEAFRIALRRLCEKPVGLARGFHVCQFCDIKPEDADPLQGNGQIGVPARGGRVFFAPTMIGHYVEVHHYLPPAEFIEAVEAMARGCE
jgi:hypothetical protein